MKPARFDYARPESIERALALLADGSDEARILAGGQSLMPILNLRLARPALLVDINGLSALAEIAETAAGLRIGALVRTADLLAHLERSRSYPLLAAALPHVAHAGIRNRGTVCGSLALADPAAELPACALCLGARITLASRGRGPRIVVADDFFTGIYETAVQLDEMILDVLFPPTPAGWRYGFEEVARRRGDYAIAGLAAGVQVEDGSITQARLVFFGIADRPVRAPATEALIAGAGAGIERTSAGDLATALASDLEVMPGGEHSTGYKLHLAGTLTRRVAQRLTEGRLDR